MAGEPSESDRIVDELVLLALLSLRHNAHVRRLAVTELQALEADVRLLLTDSRILETSRRRPRPALDADLAAVIREAYEEIDGLAADEMADLAELAGDTLEDLIPAADPLRAAVRDELAVSTLVFGATLADWWGKHAGDLSFRIGRAISDVLDGGGSERDLFVQVGAAFDTAARHSDSLLRTGEAAVLSATLLATYAANADTVSEVIHISVLDSKTTKTCFSRAGRRWSLPDYRPVGHSMVFRQTPIHWGCRSIIAPRVSGLPIPAPSTLDGFLARRTSAENAALLGKAGLDLYRSGRLTQSGLLDQSSRPLSIDQLRRMTGRL